MLSLNAGREAIVRNFADRWLTCLINFVGPNIMFLCVFERNTCAEINYGTIIQDIQHLIAKQCDRRA